APVLNAPFVDYAVRGQGEQTFVELLGVLEGRTDPRTVAGLAFRDDGGNHRINAERPWLGPDAMNAPPYERIPVDDYLRPTFLGRRSGVYQASIGCPYGCSFCGVISVFGSREKLEAPERTARHLAYLVRNHGMDGVHFYDNNFFVKEEHALELCERITPLGLSWWCEARIDAMLRFSDATWRKLRAAGLRMVFFGAESGSDEVLRRMNKKLTTAQTLELAARAREHGIIPEFSFVLGDPHEPEAEVENTLAFIRRVKEVNADVEIITYWYTPTPQRRGTYGDVDALAGTPDTLEEWTSPEWLAWMTHENPRVPWLDDTLRARVENFELVLKSRFPSMHDRRTRQWGRAIGRVLAVRRWQHADYADPRMLRAVRAWARTEPDDRQDYGHLR
ncbi:MAG TPA: radical SAM protein, partial [Longimicrobiales bacterium]|nr:radical SAM protein [Longimicrobiales bacterium]